jgi:hypothetical protein
MFVYQPIMRLEDLLEKMNVAFKDIFFPVLNVAKQHNVAWKKMQGKEFRKLANTMHDAERNVLSDKYMLGDAVK